MHLPGYATLLPNMFNQSEFWKVWAGPVWPESPTYGRSTHFPLLHHALPLASITCRRCTKIHSTPLNGTRRSPHSFNPTCVFATVVASKRLSIAAAVRLIASMALCAVTALPAASFLIISMLLRRSLCSRTACIPPGNPALVRRTRHRTANPAWVPISGVEVHTEVGIPYVAGCRIEGRMEL